MLQKGVGKERDIERDSDGKLPTLQWIWLLNISFIMFFKGPAIALCFSVNDWDHKNVLYFRFEYLEYQILKRAYLRFTSPRDNNRSRYNHRLQVNSGIISNECVMIVSLNYWIKWHENKQFIKRNKSINSFCEIINH